MKMQIGWKYHICGAFNNLEYVSPAVCEPSSSFTHDLIWLIKHPAKQQQLKIDFLSNTITLKTKQPWDKHRRFMWLINRSIEYSW